MASKLVRANVLRTVSARCYSAQAATNPADYGILPREQLKTSTLGSGVQVASIENFSPLSRVAIVFRGGSRYESAENQGATHLLRLAAGLTNAQNTAFGMTRKLQQVGASLSCSADREVLIYSADATRNHIEEVMDLLASAATKQVFKPWEVQECTPRARLDLSLTSPEVALLEDLHLAGFRQSDLARSVLAAAHALPSLSPAQLASHLSQTLLSQRLCVVGAGVDHIQLTEYAQRLDVPQGLGAAPAAQFGGGEVRTETGGRLALVAVAAEGVGTASGAPAAAQSTLQAIMGAGPVVKYGAARGLLGAAAAQSGAAAAALNAAYSDVSLVGYTVVADAADAGKAVEAVNKAFKTATLTAEDLSRGKAIVKAALLRADDNSGVCLESMAVQAATLGAVTSLESALKAVDAVTLADVRTLHKRLAGGRLCMAARGNLQHVPYLDQL